MFANVCNVACREAEKYEGEREGVLCGGASLCLHVCAWSEMCVLARPHIQSQQRVRYLRFFVCTCGALVIPLTGDDFGRAVQLGTHHRHRKRVVTARCRVSLRRLLVEPRALAKVRQLRHDVAPDENVVRLYVAVDEGLRKLMVQVREAFGGADGESVS